MSDFWARKLGAATTPATPARPASPAAAPGRAWYTHPAGAPQPQLPPTMATVPETVVTSNKAMSSKQTGHCPNCGSGNWLSPPGTNRIAPRCLECGHTDAVSGTGVANQYGAGASSTPQGGAAAPPARQLARVMAGEFSWTPFDRSLAEQ